MNVTTIISALLGFACVIASIMFNGKLSSFIDLSSIFIVVGGVVFTIGASYPMDMLRNLMKSIRIAFKNDQINLGADIDYIFDIANVARRNGLLALEELTDEMTDPFLKKGILLVVDGSDPELIRSILETEISVTKERHANNRAILDSAIAFSPAFGMLGTLIGLIKMLANLNEMDTLGSSMSVALVTTFYGVLLANMVFTPLSKRLKTLGSNEDLHKELVLEGIMAIQNGENPRVIKEKLHAYLSNAAQQQRQTAEINKKVEAENAMNP
ncbi:MAG: motility protein A [Oscillospiraceae bacterium]